ncbi:hypothetical protein SAMN05192553_11117 [Cyclobacterium xiamenense]|uniref:Uncharacterized protein n=1 Tax=Cyclobacterium xiamenense TaxID=1297121 RepID=A0A1H7BKZ5_9BACT|nr:hypothetical protein [Cyclobacterium xiamenense]SEJ74890.1 hypothetical protein SAMN05192553_11117 [Cyclobacterium xiamenense]
MFGSVILEVVIGLIFIFLLLSLLATTVSELAMNLLYSRGKNLQLALQTMLDDEQEVLCTKFFDHPLIQKLSRKGGKELPSYIRNEYFSTVLVELLRGGADERFETIEAAIADLPDGKTKEVLKTFARNANGNLTDFKKNLENWYQHTMDQATGWYKANLRKVLFGLGLVISIVFNADTLRIAERLSLDPAARQQTIALAYDFLEKREDSAARDTTLTQLQQKIQTLVEEDITSASSVLGMGWNDAPPAHIRFFSKLLPDRVWWYYVLYSMLGWIITAFAITLGAPFWFDLLKKVTNIRASGEKPTEK